MPHSKTRVLADLAFISNVISFIMHFFCINLHWNITLITDFFATFINLMPRWVSFFFNFKCLFEKTNKDPNTQVYYLIKSLPPPKKKSKHILHLKTETRKWSRYYYKSMNQNKTYSRESQKPVFQYSNIWRRVTIQKDGSRKKKTVEHKKCIRNISLGHLRIGCRFRKSGM